MNKTYKISSTILSLATVAVGAVLLIDPEISLKLICYAVAIAVLAYSSSKFVEYFTTKNERGGRSTLTLISAVFSSLLGLFLMLRPTTISQIIPIILGLFIIANGLLILGLGVVYRLFLPKHGMVSIIFGLICIILGLLCTLYSFETQFILIQFIGISLVVSGVTGSINNIFVIKAANEKSKATDVEFTTEKVSSSEVNEDTNLIEENEDVIDVEDVETN